MNLKTLSNAELTKSLTAVANRERQATVDLVEHLAEFQRRRLYLEHDCTSLFAYMTKKLRYAAPTAQNRIDAARLLLDVPELKDELESGEINLTQVSILAQGLRQKEKENDVVSVGAKRELLEKIKGCDARESSIRIGRELNVPIRNIEKVRHQHDGSVVLEITLSEAQMEALKRVKDLASHVNHNSSWAEVIELAAFRSYQANRFST